MNLYETLGVATTAARDEIKAAFRRLAKTAHPDMHGGDRVAFARIQTAYGVLMNPERRARYDATGEIVEEGPDNAHGAALACLSQTFDEALDQTLKQGMEPQHADLVALMRDQLEAGLQARDKERLQGAETRAKWRGLRDRFTTRGDCPNVMAGIIESRITGIDQITRRLDEADAVVRAALEILASHEFRFEAPPSATFTVFVTGSLSDTGTAA